MFVRVDVGDEDIAFRTLDSSESEPASSDVGVGSEPHVERKISLFINSPASHAQVDVLQKVRAGCLLHANAELTEDEAEVLALALLGAVREMRRA